MQYFNLSEIAPGDELEYLSRDRKVKQQRRGTVKQITEHLIAVKGERYPDTILVNDLLSGQAQILRLFREGKEVKAKKAPSPEELEALWKKHGQVNPISKEIGVSWARAKKWLIDAGIIDDLSEPIKVTQDPVTKTESERQTPPPEPAKAANQEPVQGAHEPAENIIPEPSCPFDGDIILLPGKREGFIATPQSPLSEDVLVGITKESKERRLLANAGHQILMDTWSKVIAVINDPVALAVLKKLDERGLFNE